MATGYGGTYKAVVLDNNDPMGQNRLMVRVPSVADEVLVQFEGGDPDHPEWTGVQ